MIDRLEILALRATYVKDSEYFERKVRRYYSEKFHTPLFDVYELPWPFVFTNYLEHVLEMNNTKEELQKLVTEICYPERNEEKELEKRIKQIEAEEEAKRQAKKQKEESTKVEKKPEPENPHTEEPDINMGVGDFAHLEKEMEEDD
jgi:hypothetical protein